jgi:biotin operon repressor
MKTRKWKDITADIEEIKETIIKVKNHEEIPESDKNKMLEDLRRIMNKLKNQGIAIFTDEVFYGKAPTKFLRNPKIKLQAKGLYAVMHSYSQPKELMLNLKTFVSLKTLSGTTGLKRTQIIYWIRHLEDIGWITVKRRGLNMSNWYILHSKKKYRKN